MSFQEDCQTVAEILREEQETQDILTEDGSVR